MHRTNGWRLTVLCLALGLFVGGALRAGTTEGKTEEERGPAPPSLTSADCVKCHPQLVAENQQRGGKHREAVGCMDCHRGHPPLVPKEKVIPACSDCHAGKPHYALQKCGACHVNPHAPLVLSLTGKLTKPCLTCHAQQGKEMQEHPSAHAQLACNDCHKQAQGKHGGVPSCLECHEPHGGTMKAADCARCHPAHRPTLVTYAGDIPSGFCTACHQKVGAALGKTKTKHHDLACVRCHEQRHGTVPTCESCHGKPHSPQMLAKFPKCLTCHVDAHDLQR